MPQRFDIVSGFMQKWPDGNWISYDDYESLMLMHMAEVDLIKEVVSDFFDSLPNAGTGSWDLDKLNLINQITAIAEGK